jgi:EAL domain-containing protein (putative c-di-GMP-specific phosphodiesterase class I)
VYPAENGDANDVIRQADTAMYDAKDKGRDAVSVYTDSMLAENQDKLRLYSDLRMAIAKGAFHLAFQPQYDEQDRMTGAEVLVRWTHEGKPVFPDRFIRAAEDTNQILALGRWILRESLQTLRRWHDQRMLPATFRTLAINISAMQFVDPWFEDMLYEEMESAGLAPDAIELELTESVFVGDKNIVRDKMRRLSQKGFAFALDDFGTGYSSLSYLQNLPIDKLKIDRSFVMDIQEDGSPARIVDSIIHLSRNLEMQVLAEGVETAAQRDYLREHGCKLYQGYFFSRPLLQDDFERLAGGSKA